MVRFPRRHCCQSGGDKLGRKHIIAVASLTESPPPHLGKECITHGLACIHSVIYLMPYIFLCVHDEILPLFQCHLNFFVVKVFFIFSFAKRLMQEHAFLFFWKGHAYIKMHVYSCRSLCSSVCSVRFVFLIWLTNVRKCKKKHFFKAIIDDLGVVGRS